MPTTEKIIHQQICSYLDLQYPNVYYFSDASGMRVTVGLRNELKRKRCKRYKILDITVLHPASGYHGLVLEVKISVNDVLKKDGSLKSNEHIIEQYKSINRLQELGYKALFVCGFEHAKETIDNYMSDAKKETTANTLPTTTTQFSLTKKGWKKNNARSLVSGKS